MLQPQNSTHCVKHTAAISIQVKQQPTANQIGMASDIDVRLPNLKEPYTYLFGFPSNPAFSTNSTYLQSDRSRPSTHKLTFIRFNTILSIFPLSFQSNDSPFIILPCHPTHVHSNPLFVSLSDCICNVHFQRRGLWYHQWKHNR